MERASTSKSSEGSEFPPVLSAADVDTDLSRFERELEKLRKEMETASATGGSVNGSTSVTNTPFVDRPTSPPSPANGGLGLDASPLVLPSASSGDTPSKVDSFSLDRNDDREEVLVDAKE
jgi:hypothetical protein